MRTSRTLFWTWTPQKVRHPLPQAKMYCQNKNSFASILLSKSLDRKQHMFFFFQVTWCFAILTPESKLPPCKGSKGQTLRASTKNHSNSQYQGHTVGNTQLQPPNLNGAVLKLCNCWDWLQSFQLESWAMATAPGNRVEEVKAGFLNDPVVLCCTSYIIQCQKEFLFAKATSFLKKKRTPSKCRPFWSTSSSERTFQRSAGSSYARELD